MAESKKAVFFGELLMRLAARRYERLVQAREFEIGYTGAEANAAVSLANYGMDDLNYRRKLWTPEKARRVLTDLMQHVDVLMGNEEDSTLVLGVAAQGVDVARGELDAERYKEVAAELHRRFGFKYVATTLRESLSASENGWSCLLSDGRQCYLSRQYRIWVVDRVGGGDAFSGGLIYALLSGMSAQDSVEFAAAASCLKHSIHGDFNQVNREEVMALVRGGGSGRIQR